MLLPWLPPDLETDPALDAAPPTDAEHVSAADQAARSAPDAPPSGPGSRADAPPAAPSAPPASAIFPTVVSAAAATAAASPEALPRPALGECELLEQTLGDRRNGPVRLVAPQNADDNRLVDLAQGNAREEAHRQERGGAQDILTRLGAALHLPGPPHRLECVDVSHTGGKQTRVGLVVFEGGRPERGQYRNYAMPDSGDDYATLHAWVSRRLESGPPWPDLLLIDGGRGQLHTVQRALREAGHEALFPLAAIAKARDEAGHADRRAGNVADRIFTPDRVNPLPLREGSPELLFLQNVRDTAHRFVIGRHRRARRGAALSGELMRLPGIGPATARLLWDHFGSVEAMRAASLEDLRRLPGIGPAKAALLLQKLAALQ